MPSVPDSPSPFAASCCGDNARSLFSTGPLIVALLLPFAFDFMDPVSAVGFVASILQLVAAAKSAIVLGRDAVNATKDQRDLLLEVQNITPLLEDLQHRLQQPKNQSVNTFIQKLEKPLEQLNGTMEHIVRKLGSSNKVGSTALMWTFWNKTEVDADLAKIERFKTVLNAWLLLDTWDAGQQQEKNHSQIRQDQYRLLTEVKSLAQNEQDFHASAGLSLLDIRIRPVCLFHENRDTQQKSHDQISKTLSSSSNTQRQDNYRILTEVRNVAQDQREVKPNVKKSSTGCHPSISSHGTQIYSELDKREPANGCWRTLGLEPGCYPLGNCLVLWDSRGWENCFSSDGVAVAAAYLNHKESEVQSPSNILAGLWWQLVSERPISAAVQKLYQKHQKKRTRPSLAEVCDIVRSTVAEWSRVFIVIDVLDEYPEDHRRILLDTLAAIGAVSLLLTSRSNIAPEAFFPTVPVVEIRAREEDIRRYIDVHIQTSARLSKHIRARPELRAEIESKIISNVDGMQVSARETSPGFFGHKNYHLEHTYNEAMDRIEVQNKDDREIARQALIWVANAKRPLSVHELCEALAIKLGATTLDADDMLDIEFIVSVCAGLLIVDQVVRLVHHTTQDYIERVQPSRFPRAQTEITSQCLTYISFQDFRGHKSRDQPSLYRKYKLLSYASHYCLLHAAGEPEVHLQERIIDFLSDAHRWRSPFLGGRGPPQWHYLNWPSVSSNLRVAAIFGLQGIMKHLLEFDQSISKEEKDIVRLLIKHGANVNAAGGSYGNALHTAAAMGHVSVVQELIANGIDVNVRGRPYSSALNAALERGHEGVAVLLIENGAVHDDRTLQVALKKGHNTVAQLLIKKGTNTRSSLHAASAIGDIAVVQFLIEHGVDVNLEGGKYGTALRAASAKGKAEVVQLLLDNGADVNLQGGHYGTALHAASAQGDITVMQLLLNNGADVNLLGRHYETALQAASAKGDAEVVQLLLDHGADVGAQRGHYGTALNAASAKGKAKVVQLLLAHSASRTINARDGTAPPTVADLLVARLGFGFGS
ncbi:hypothetical protein C8J57DRAFT_1458321 [Mycena rebaudengoi]|nr:hypothetical protein C8J57DRAFT_1458321 [Mycena rebaudengoi]